MTLRTLVLLALGICLWATAPSSANAQSSLAQMRSYLQTANNYDQVAKQIAARGDYITAQRYRDAANILRQLAAQASGGQSAPKQPQQQQPQQRQDNSAQIRQDVERGREWALDAIAKWNTTGSLRNKRSVTITWRPGPTYQGQGFGATRSSTVSVDQARRYINMLSNNGHQVTGLQAF